MWASMWPAQLMQRSLKRLFEESRIHREDVWRGVRAEFATESTVARVQNADMAFMIADRGLGGTWRT